MSERTGSATMIIGFGMGGLLDFLLLHLVLQWHHMISRRVPPVGLESLRENIFWDGVGQAVMWGIVLAGILLLFHSIRSSGTLPSALPSTSSFLGYFVIGWGIFNLLDGLVNHHLLGLHDVREDVENVLVWNLGFLAIGGVLLPLLGWWMVRAGQREADWA